MIISSEGSKPIYLQIAEWLETEILKEHFLPDQKIYSQYQLAELLTINPATAAKGLNLLVEKNILYKKRGLGMFVTTDAKAKLLEERTERTLKKLVHELVLEAYRLNMDEKQIIEMIKKMNKEVKGEKNEDD